MRERCQLTFKLSRSFGPKKGFNKKFPGPRPPRFRDAKRRRGVIEFLWDRVRDSRALARVQRSLTRRVIGDWIAATFLNISENESGRNPDFNGPISGRRTPLTLLTCEGIYMKKLLVVSAVL